MGDDYELLRAWRDGNEGAGNALVDRHFGSVYRFFRSKVDVEVEDLTQRTFLACLEGLDRIREGGNFRAYLLGIARHLLFRQYRQKRNRAKIEDFLTVSSDDLRGSPSQMASMRQEQKLLLTALRAIPVDFQIAVELHYWEGMSVADIATVLGVAPGTVKSRLFRARQMLREQITSLAATEDLLKSTVDNLEGWAKDLRGLLAGPSDDDGDEPNR